MTTFNPRSVEAAVLAVQLRETDFVREWGARA